MRFAWTTFSNHTWRLLIHKLTGLMKSRAYNPSAVDLCAHWRTFTYFLCAKFIIVWAIIGVALSLLLDKHETILST